MGIRRQPLEQILIARGLAPEQVAEVQAQADKTNGDFMEGAARADGIDGEMLARAIAESTGLPYLPSVDLDQISEDLIRPLPLGLAREQGVLPLWIRDGHVEVAISSPRSLPALDDLRVLFDLPVRALVVSPSRLRD